MSEQVGERKGSGPFKEGTIKHACYEVLKNAGARGLTVRTPARASFIPSRTPPSAPPIFLLRKQEIIDGQVLRDPSPSNARCRCPTSSKESAAAAWRSSEATLRRTPSSASSRKVRAPPATLSDAPRYLKKGCTAPHPHLAAVPPCHADLFSPSSLLRPDANFVLVRKATYALNSGTLLSLPARRGVFPRARRGARASLGPVFFLGWGTLESLARLRARRTPARRGLSRASARVRRLTRHSPRFPTRRIHRPREQRLRTYGFPGALRPSSLPFAHPPPRSG